MMSVSDTLTTMTDSSSNIANVVPSSGVSVVDIVALVISAIAVGISVWAIFEAKSRERSRKLKDTIIGELMAINEMFVAYLNPIVSQKQEYSCQETISWFKFSMMKIEAISSFITSSLNVDDSHVSNIKNKVHSLREDVTDCTSFRQQYNEPQYSLNEGEILKVEKTYSELYEIILKMVNHVNIVKPKNK